MTSFVHVEQPATHPGVARAEAVIDHLRAARRSFDGARGLAVLLLSAIVASLLVVADKLVSTWNDGGLLVAWLVLWGVAFAALAFFAGTARGLALRVSASVRAAARRRAAARADAQFLAYAEKDPRILSELQAISARQEEEVPTLSLALSQVRLGQQY